MVVIVNNASQRRKSVAIVSSSATSPNAGAQRNKKKRSQSLVPGDIATIAKSFRHKMPRKSILKQASYQEEEEGSGEYTTDLRDNTTRKSLINRRVSFAEHAHVRIFETQNTNGTASPVSSPAAATSASPATSSAKSKENGPVTPVTFTSTLPDSPPQDSQDFDDASEDMSFDDDTAPRQSPPSNNEDEDDMDMTEAIAAHIRSRSSLSRRRSSRRRSSYGAGSEDMDIEDEDGGEPMEFTVPLAQTLKQSGPPDPAWLALRAVTHSGDHDPEPEPQSDDDANKPAQNMELDDAMARLRAVQLSHGIGTGLDVAEAGDSSYATSTEDSVDSNPDDYEGDRTVNLTGLLGRASFRSDMESTGVYGGALLEESPPNLRTSPAPEPPNPLSVQKSSPSKEARKENSPPSPRELSPAPPALSSVSRGAVFSNTPISSFKPKKRPAVTDPDTALPSPAKRKPFGTSSLQGENTLSPDKSRAPLTPADGPSNVLTPSLKVNATFDRSRRPSGYLSRRKSSIAATNIQNSQPLEEPDLRSPSRSPKATIAGAGDRTTVSPLEVPTQQVIDSTEQWRSEVHSDFESEDDDGPPISIEQFFAMTEIRFMDDLTCPRRSTIHPSQFDRRLSTSDSVANISQAEYLTAVTLDIPQLEFMSWVAADLTGWIEQSKKNFLEAEVLAAHATPALFREYSQANDAGRAELQHQLKLIKANHHATAKAKWYDYKLVWIQNLSGEAQKAFDALEKDARIIEQSLQQAQQVLPQLRDEYAEIARQLEEEEQSVAELEESDHDYLNELKVTIADQNGVLDTFRADVAEGQAKLERLHDKLEEVLIEKREAQQGIADAKRVLNTQRHSTRAEVFRLKDELEGLQNVHLWSASKVDSAFLQLIYNHRHQLELPCSNYTPKIGNPTFTLLQSSATRTRRNGLMKRFPELDDVYVHAMQECLNNLKAGSSTREVIEILSDASAAFALLRKQLSFLSIKYPTVLEGHHRDFVGLRAVVTVLVDGGRAKAKITFSFDSPTLSAWPATLSNMQCDVEVVYGNIMSQNIYEAVMGRLQKSDVLDSHGCLLDACLEATVQCGA